MYVYSSRYFEACDVTECLQRMCASGGNNRAIGTLNHTVAAVISLFIYQTRIWFKKFANPLKKLLFLHRKLELNRSCRNLIYLELERVRN